MTKEFKLGWVARAIVPQRDKPVDLSGPIPWVRIEDFDGKYLSASRSGQGVTPQQVASMPLRVFPPRTVITSCSCVMGSTAIVQQPLVTNQTFIGLVPDESRLLSDYLYYYLQSIQQDLQAKALGSIQQYLSKAEFLSLRMPLPALDEQQKIADFLDDRMARIDQITRIRRDQISILDEYVRSNLATVLTGDQYMPLRHLIEDERLGIWGLDPGEAGLNVQVARVADFARPEFRLGSTCTIRSVSPDQARSRLVQHGDVLLERSGGTQRNPVGCPAFVEDPGPRTVSSNFVSRLRPRREVDGRYLSLVLGALYATRQQAPHSTQTTGIMNLNTGSYFSLRVPMLSKPRQVEVRLATDDDLTTMRAEQGQLQKSIDLLTEYKQSLIAAAVTGELEVTTAGSGIPG